MTFQELNYPRRKNFIKTLNILLDTAPVLSPQKLIAAKLLNRKSSQKIPDKNISQNFSQSPIKIIENKKLQSLRKLQSRQKAINATHKLQQNKEENSNLKLNLNLNINPNINPNINQHNYQSQQYSRHAKSAHQSRQQNKLKINKYIQQMKYKQSIQDQSSKRVLNTQRSTRTIYSLEKQQRYQKYSILQQKYANPTFNKPSTDTLSFSPLTKSTQLLPNQAQPPKSLAEPPPPQPLYLHQSVQIKRNSEGLLYDYRPKKFEKKQFLKKGAHIKTKIVNNIIKMKLLKEYRNQYGSIGGDWNRNANTRSNENFNVRSNLNIKKFSHSKNDSSSTKNIINTKLINQQPTTSPNPNLYIDQQQYLNRKLQPTDTKALKKPPSLIPTHLHPQVHIDPAIQNKQILNLIKLYKGTYTNRKNNKNAHSSTNSNTNLNDNGNNKNRYTIISKEVIKERQKSPYYIQGWFNESGEFEPDQIQGANGNDVDPTARDRAMLTSIGRSNSSLYNSNKNPVAQQLKSSQVNYTKVQQL